MKLAALAESRWGAGRSFQNFLYATDAEGYSWPNGAAMAAECLVTGQELLVTPEHALHVLEIMIAARESQATGKRVALSSTFKWPVVS
jgi:predicted dehydrogenase